MNRDEKQIHDEPEPFHFSSLRRDWYVANSALPRAVRSCMEGRRVREFRGFPRQWIPVFEWYGVPWADTIAPEHYIPFFSDLTEDRLLQIVQRAKEEKSLRILVESATMYDAVLSDFLYILDNTAKVPSLEMKRDLEEISDSTGTSKRRRLILNGWQSYGRPSLRSLESTAMAVGAKADVAVALPCALKRPYGKSRTHQKIYHILLEHGYSVDHLHRIVITSLGVLPEEVWEMPQVLTYDAGVPDIYRTLRLVRTYFRKAQYTYVLDCLQFEPYSDVLRIAQREGIIKEIRKVKIPGQGHFYIRP